MRGGKEKGVAVYKRVWLFVDLSEALFPCLMGVYWPGEAKVLMASGG